MKKRSLLQKAAAILTALSVVSGFWTVIPEIESSARADSDYTLSISDITATQNEATTVTATVMKGDEEVTDLAAEGLWIYIWDSNISGESIQTQSLTFGVTFTTTGEFWLNTCRLHSSNDDGSINWDGKLSEKWPKVTCTASTTDDDPDDDDPVDEVTYTLSVPSTMNSAVGESFTITATITGSDGSSMTESDLGTLARTSWWDQGKWEDSSAGYSAIADTDSYSFSDNTISTTITINTAGTYEIGVGLFEMDDSWTVISKQYITITVTEADGYTVSLSPSATEADVNGSVTVTATVKNNGTVLEEISQDEDVYLWWWVDSWNDHADGNSDATLSDYDDNSGKSLTCTFTLPSEGTYYLVATLKNSTENLCDPVYVTITVTDSSTAIESEISVTKVALDDDFITGVDISSVISEFDSGVVYYDYDGNPITDVNSFVSFLANCGVTSVRVRVWNNPYDSDGNSYGGGNCTVAQAATIASACKAAGITMLVDFHLSDFWADPGKQTVPKAWASMTLDEKETAVHDFILASLNTIDSSASTVTMVQVGNETTTGVCGESTTANMCEIFAAGASAVRDYSESCKVVIHVTNPNNGYIKTWADNLNNYEVDYDVLATSYYPYWHGTFSNLKSQFQYVINTYGKEVMVAETSYAYTLNDSDGHDNTVREGTNDSGFSEIQPFTVQGQANAIRNLVAAVNEAGGIGVYYWEPAWITVGNTLDLEGDEYTAQVEANSEIWRTCGSGWASQYAGEYETDAATWYGGSAVDNEAWFYADGTALATAQIYKLIRAGASSNVVTVESIDEPSETIYIGDSYELPSTVDVTYSTGSVSESVTWDSDDIAAVDTTTSIASSVTYEISGTVTFSKTVTSGDYAGATTAEVTYTLTVLPENLITDKNDASLETGTNFTISGSGISALPYTNEPQNVVHGSSSLHWYNGNETAAEGYLTYNNAIELEAGEYTFEAQAQGEIGDSVTMQILDSDGSVLFEGTASELSGWHSWTAPSVSFALGATTTVTLRVKVSENAGGWGSLDCLYLHKTKGATLLDLEISDSSISIDKSYILENLSSFFSSGDLTKLTENALNCTLVVKVTSGVTDSEKNLLVYGGYKNTSSYFTVEVYKVVGDTTTQLTETDVSIPIEVTLSSSDVVSGATYGVLDYHGDSAVLFSGTISGSTVSASIDKFSPMNVVYKTATDDDDDDDDDDKNGDNGGNDGNGGNSGEGGGATDGGNSTGGGSADDANSTGGGSDSTDSNADNGSDSSTTESSSESAESSSTEAAAEETTVTEDAATTEEASETVAAADADAEPEVTVASADTSVASTGEAIHTLRILLVFIGIAGSILLIAAILIDKRKFE